MLVFLLKKNKHLFQIIDEDVGYQYHDHEFVHVHKEDQVMLHHNVIHLYQELFSIEQKKIRSQIK